jgi:hypothetical protein
LQLPTGAGLAVGAFVGFEGAVVGVAGATLGLGPGALFTIVGLSATKWLTFSIDSLLRAAKGQGQGGRPTNSRQMQKLKLEPTLPRTRQTKALHC